MNINTNENIDTNRCWSVYLHTVPKEIRNAENDKYYVGITSKEPEKRWGKDGYKYKGQIFYRAIEKYGWDNIKHEILADNLIEEEASELEKYYIEYYKSTLRQNGYNVNYGGYQGGGVCKNIAQYSLDGYFLNLFPSRLEAAKHIGIDSQYIHLLIDTDDDRKQSHGYMWRNVDPKGNFPHKIDPYPEIICNRPILQYDLHGVFIREWNSIIEASIYYNTSNISNACQGRCLSAVGFQWRYKYGDNRPVGDIEGIKQRYGKLPVYLYDIYGNFIKKYDTVFDAIHDLHIARKISINDIANDIYDNEYYGYRWTLKYYEKLPPLKHIRSQPIVQIDLLTKTPVNIFINNKMAYASFGKKHGSQISQCCNNKIKQVFGYKWKYIQDIKESDITDSFLLQKYRFFLPLIDSSAYDVLAS